MADVELSAGTSGSVTIPEGVYTFDAVIIGGGGAGGNGATGPYKGGGGSGAGSGYWNDVACTPGNTLNYMVGAGGVNGVSSGLGDSTTLDGYTANGGYGGIDATDSMHGTSYGAGATASGGSGSNSGSDGSNGSVGGTGGTGGGGSGFVNLGGTGGNGASDSSMIYAQVGGDYGAGGGGGDGDGSYQTAGNGGPGRIAINWATRTDLYPPTSVGHTNVAEDGFRITYMDASSNESGYEYEVVLNVNSFMNTASDTGAADTSYKDITALDPDTAYKYQVRAVDSGLIISSSWVSGTTVTTDPLGVPNTLGAANITDTTADISWMNNSTSNTGYEVELIPFGDTFMGSATSSPASSSEEITGLTAGTHYKFKVRAVKTTNGPFYSDWSSEYDFTMTGGGGNTALGYFSKTR